MNTSAETHGAALEQARTTIANHSAAVDREGAFPSASIEALKAAGLLAWGRKPVNRIRLRLVMYYNCDNAGV
jgi:hypothetical protein